MMLSSTIPIGVSGNTEEAGLVKSNQDGNGMSGVDGGEMYADCGF